MKNTTLRALDRETPGALRTLHGIFRFDFEKPFSAVRVCGPFTLRRVRDALAEKRVSSDTGENEIALILKPAPERYHETPLRLVRLMDDCEVVADEAYFVDALKEVPEELRAMREAEGERGEIPRAKVPPRAFTTPGARGEFVNIEDDEELPF